MGVYIKGMEMPKRGHTATITIVGSGQAYVEYFDCRPHVKETIEYAAVPVPPHRRLIDADALMHEFEKAQRTMAQHGREYSCSFMSSSQELSTEWYCVEDMLENAPTIIEAEEGE